jgi:hypothetical protein
MPAATGAFSHSPSAQAVIAQDMAVPAGIYEVTQTWSAAIADFNNDGYGQRC